MCTIPYTEPTPGLLLVEISRDFADSLVRMAALQGVELTFERHEAFVEPLAPLESLGPDLPDPTSFS